jgi:hypothetical protein
MDTTSFYFETYNLKYNKHDKEEKDEEINKKKLYSEINNFSGSFNMKKE